jgi:hypothetical protein
MATALVRRAEGAASQGSHSISRTGPQPSTSKPPALVGPGDELAPLLSPWIPAHGDREIRRALTTDERGLVAVRSAALRAGLTGYAAAEHAAVKAQIAAMLGGFRSMRQQDDDAERLVEVTAGVLREFPLWAITRGCLKIARNRAGLDRRFAPNDAEIFGVVSEEVRSYRRTLVTAEALLIARVEAPPAPKLTREEIEAKLGRPLPVGRVDKPKSQPLPGDGKHAARVAADLASRHAESPARSAGATAATEGE